MSPARFLLRQLGYDLTSGLLFRPALYIGVLAALALILPPLETHFAPAASAWLATEPASAQVLLGTLAGSMMTVVSVVYSILLVALSLASVQFSTRVLAGMMRSRVSQNTMGLFGGTFVYCLVLLRAVHVDPAAVPGVALTFALVLALSSLGALVYFIHHIVQSIQANHLVDRIANETESVLDQVFREEGPVEDQTPPPVPEGAAAILSERSGYLQLVNLSGLARLVPPGGRLWIARPLGAFVTRGLPLAYVTGPAPEAAAVRLCFDIGPVRTMQDDVEFGLRQIVDIALKAISPAVNDPSTAATCIDHLGRLLVRLSTRRNLPVEVGPLVVPRPTHGDLIDLAFEQLRQYGRTDMAVALRLMRTLGEVASVTRHRGSLARLEAHARLIENAARGTFAEDDCDELGRRRARVRAFTGTLAALLLAIALPARAQIDFSGEVPSLTGAREAEMLATYAFAKERPRMYAPVELLHLPLTPYTEMDDEAPWSEVRADTTLRYARYVFGRCGIVLDRGELGRLARAEMDKAGEKHRRGAGHGETLVYLVHEIPGRTVARLESSETKYPFQSVTIEDGVPVLTPLPHSLGLRLNASVSEERGSLMLNDRTLLRAFGPSLAAAAGFFDPKLFGFTDEDCNTMREALLRETRCAPRAYVFDGKRQDPWTFHTFAERRAARRGDVPWPFGEKEPDDLVAAPVMANDGLVVFALHEGVWRGFFWRYSAPPPVSRGLPGAVEPYEGFAVNGGLGLAVHPAGHEIALVTFAEGTTAQVHATPWPRAGFTKRRPRPVRTESVPCRVFLTSGPVGAGDQMPLAVVCHDRVWRIYKGREPESFPLPKPARWGSLSRRCNDDVQLWLGLEDGGLALYRIPAFGPLEAEPLPAWAAWPAVREVPFNARWGGTPRSLDRVNVRRFDASQTPRWGPPVSEIKPAETGLWVRFEDVHGPGWVGFRDGRLIVE